MALRKTTPLLLVVMMFTTVMIALPAANGGGVLIPPSAFAQSSSLAQEIIDETATSVQDSSAGENVLEDNNEFGDEVAAIDQDNTADQDAANLGTQDEDAAQEQDVQQDATQEDFDVQAGESLQQSQQQPPQTEPPPPPPPPEEDTTPPTLTVPEDITVEATSTVGAVVRFEVTAEDNVDGTATLDEENTLTQDDDVGGDITIICSPPSGSEFPIGSTEVECTATDEAGNTATASFTVTFQDTRPPILSVPDDMVVEATSTEGAQVTYVVRAVDRFSLDGEATLNEDNMLIQDDVGGDIIISCDPPSGSEFPMGETVVECTATDQAGNIGSASFTVTVNPAPEEEITTHYDTGRIVCNFNDNTPQQCDVPFRVTIETQSVLKVGITVSPEHCSSTNYYVSVDGDEDTFGGTFIGRAGYSAIGDDTRTIPPYDFGTVESGSHTLDIWVEGIPGGCNQGQLFVWQATVTVITSELA